jgi:hypothetical protein
MQWHECNKHNYLCINVSLKFLFPCENQGVTWGHRANLVVTCVSSQLLCLCFSLVFQTLRFSLQRLRLSLLLSVQWGITLPHHEDFSVTLGAGLQNHRGVVDRIYCDWTENLMVPSSISGEI